MTVFLDSDVLLDCVLERSPHVQASGAVLALCEAGLHTGLTSILVLANSYYVVAKLADARAARTSLMRLREVLQVCAAGDRELGQALVADFEDVEDGIQHFVAVNNRAEVIITRNLRHYVASTIPVMTPSQFITAFHYS